MSFCRSTLSWVFFTCLYMMQSSPKSRTSDVISSVMSFMYRRNRSGPSTVPCGTPDVTCVETMWLRPGQLVEIVV